MSIKVPVTYTEYKNFPLASDVSRKLNSYSKIIPIVAAAPVFIFYKGENLFVGILLYLVIAVLGILLVRSFHNPAVIKAMFGSLKELTEEQKKAFVNAFMHGKPIGRGDMEKACMAANMLLKEELALRNRKITKEQYSVNIRNIAKVFQVELW